MVGGPPLFFWDMAFWISGELSGALGAEAASPVGCFGGCLLGNLGVNRAFFRPSFDLSICAGEPVYDGID